MESIPSYDEEVPLPSLPPPTLVRKPSRSRRVVALLLFVVVAGSASAVLGLAILRMMGHTILP